MSKYFLDVLILSAVCLSWFNRSGFAFNIAISPNKVSGLVHNDVTIRCGLDKSEANVKEILLLELSKGDERIAVLRQPTKISVSQGLRHRFQAEGNIFESALDSYLRVTLTNAKLDDSGSYTCMVYFLDQLAVLKETRESANLSVSDMDLKSAVLFLVDKVSNLETELTLQKSNNSFQLQEQKRDFSAAFEKQKNESAFRQNQLQEQILALNSQVDIESNNLDQYNNTSDDQIVYFKATHTKSGVFQAGSDLIYSHVLENVGEAYDGNTGIFTAPVKGFYLFAVSVTPYNGQWIYVDLKSSDGEVISRLFAYENIYADYTQSSSVTKLNARQTVRPVIKRVDNSFTIYSEEINDPLNTFSGFLLRKL